MVNCEATVQQASPADDRMRAATATACATALTYDYHLLAFVTSAATSLLPISATATHVYDSKLFLYDVTR